MAEISKHPLVTVICSTYNSEATLHCALRSVLNQDLTDFEVLVIGDACTDGTPAVIVRLNDRRVQWHNLPQNSGSQSEPNNEGLRRARGRYVAFIGHDDLWFPWHLSGLVKHIEQTGADLVHDLIAGVEAEGLNAVHGPPHPQSGYKHVIVPPSCWLHRRELPLEVGFWKNPRELTWAIDYDFTRRVAEAGKKIEFLPALGVVKFPSTSWSLYSRTGEMPQTQWLASILADPQGLSQKTLLRFAALLAQRSQIHEKIPLAMAWQETKIASKATLKACLRGLTSWYGQDKWPVNGLLKHRLRRTRARQRIARGLAARPHN